MNSLHIWYRNLSRPTITHVQAIVFENGEKVDLTKYNDEQLEGIQKSIDELCRSPDLTHCWFETESRTQYPCFQKKIVSLRVTCYKDDKMRPQLKKPTGIPIKFRNKMFDRYHPIQPKQGFLSSKSAKMEVRFVLY